MATCHVCGGQIKQGETSLEFRENGMVVKVQHIPALVCECGEVRIKSPVAEYVSDLVDEVLGFEHVQRKRISRWIPIRQIALELSPPSFDRATAEPEMRWKN